MDIDPIQERTSSIDKIKKWLKTLFKPSKDLNKEFQKLSEQTSKDINMTVQAVSNFGISCEEAGKRLVQFSKVLTPSQMREIVYSENTTLYADGKPYCIIDKKGEPIWLEKNK